MSKLVNEVTAWCDALLGCVPGSAGVRLRRAWNGTRLNSVGAAASWGMNTAIAAPRNVSAGSDFSIMRGSSLLAVGGRIVIGNRVSVNSNVLIDASDGGAI